jgi:hypothetical protein
VIVVCPEIRKLIKLGHGYVVSLPTKWIKYYEKIYGVQITEVLVEVNDFIRIKPYFDKSLGKKETVSGIGTTAAEEQARATEVLDNGLS